MSKSGFRPCAARVSEQIRKILSFVFAVVMPISVEGVFDGTSAFLVLGKGFQYVMLKFAGMCRMHCSRAFFCSSVKTGGGGRTSEACEKSFIFVSERIFLHFSIKGLPM